MPYLRKRDTGAITDWLNSGSLEYELLNDVKFQTDVTAAVPPTTTGIPSGMTGGAIKAGQPMFEEVAQEDVQADPPGGRIIVIAVPGPLATAATDETFEYTPAGNELGGTLTDVEYVPSGAIPGDAVNNRIITLNEVRVTGTASPARSVTALATRTFDATHAGVAGVPMPLTISQAAFLATPPDQLSVASTHGGTGQVEPGGVLYAVYTRA